VAKVKTIDQILEASAASEEFKDAVRRLADGYRTPQLIESSIYHPNPKVLRVVLKLLDTHPQAPIERVKIGGVSGCANFVGTVSYFVPEEHRVRFNWNCKWKARQESYFLPDGRPDQARAAAEFDYECFREFEEEA
jgi:hypothetical protein